MLNFDNLIFISFLFDHVDELKIGAIVWNSNRFVW